MPLPYILVVDDDPELVSIIETAIGPRADVVAAHNWTDARKRLSEETFDLILLDLFLPDADLLEPLEAIREIDLDYPVILMSANLDDETDIVGRAQRLGVNTLLRKPFHLETLQARIAEHLPNAGDE